MLLLYAVSCFALALRRHQPIGALLVVTVCWLVPLLIGLVPYAATGTVISPLPSSRAADTAVDRGRMRRCPSALRWRSCPSPWTRMTHSNVPGSGVCGCCRSSPWARGSAEQSEREATQRVRTAAAEERVQIARELHDVLAHSVTLMVVQAEAAEELMDCSPNTAL
jgi:signal transduction histidine kinase